MDSQGQHPLLIGPQEGVMIVEGLIFLKPKLIESNSSLVQRAFSDFYRTITHN